MVASIRDMAGHVNGKKDNTGALLVELSPERTCLEDPPLSGLNEPVSFVQLLGTFQTRHLVAARSNSSSRLALDALPLPLLFFLGDSL